MQWDSLEDVEASLHAVIDGRACSAAWLGVGNVLFLAFGEETLPPIFPGARVANHVYELQVDSADWWIEDQLGRVAGRSTDGRDKVEAAAALLVGRCVSQWRFADPSPALQIAFEGGVTLKMAPYADADPSEGDAWVLRMPVFYGYMRWDGSMGIGRRDHYFLCDEPD